MTSRIAGIDCGTNSVRLLVADVEDGVVVDVVREMRIVRLGQDVDRTGRLADEAIARTQVALAHYRDVIAATGASAVRMVATSATRDAANRSDFVRMVRDVLGIDPEVVTGAEEAALSFRGAVAGLRSVRFPLLVTDIGGGSSEIVLGSESGGLHAHSMDVGSVRLTERHVHDDPPTPAQIEAVRHDVRAALAAQDVPLRSAATVVAVAGTATTVAALALGLAAYDSARVHGSVLAAGQVDAVVTTLARSDRVARSAMAVIHPGRVDVITAGALILQEVISATGAAEVVVSEHDILDGIVLSSG